MFDTIIIGSGPAGISAGLYLKRINTNVLIFTNNNSALKKAHLIENYYGFNSISGDELYNKGIDQAKRMKIEILEEEVLEIKKEEYFEIVTIKNTYKSKSLILATGISRTNSGIKGISDYEGKGLSYCATCDGFFYKDKNIAVIGNGDYAIREINHLLNITKNITILTNGEEVNTKIKELNLKIIDSTINELNGNGKVEMVSFEDGNTLKIDGVFVAIGVADAIAFAKTIGLATEKNFLIVNDKFETNIEGLFAIGDCIGGLLQISKAVNDGAKVSKEIIKFLKK